jgi:hypothetical protein
MATTALAALPGGAFVAAEQAPQTIVIEATIVSGSPAAVKALHQQWSVLPAEIPTGQSAHDPSSTPQAGKAKQPGGAARGGASVSQTVEQMTALMHAMQNDPRGNIPLAPKITLFNGQYASVTLAEKAGDKPGLELKCVPVVSDDRRSVRLCLAVNADDALEAMSKSSQFNLADGHTVLLDVTCCVGSSPARRELGVPMLDKIPYVSRLFVNTPRKTDAEQALLLVTPRVIVLEEEEEKLGLDIEP